MPTGWFTQACAHALITASAAGAGAEVRGVSGGVANRVCAGVVPVGTWLPVPTSTPEPGAADEDWVAAAPVRAGVLCTPWLTGTAITMINTTSPTTVMIRCRGERSGQ